MKAVEYPQERAISIPCLGSPENRVIWAEIGSLGAADIRQTLREGSTTPSSAAPSGLPFKLKFTAYPPRFPKWKFPTPFPSEKEYSCTPATNLTPTCCVPVQATNATSKMPPNSLVIVNPVCNMQKSIVSSILQMKFHGLYFNWDVYHLPFCLNACIIFIASAIRRQ